MRLLFVLMLGLMLGVLARGVVRADTVCQSPQDMIVEAQAHENYAGHVVLSAAEVVRAMALVTGGPEPTEVRDGLLIRLKTTVLLLVIWTKDGVCGYSVAPPPINEQMLRLIRGTDA